MMLSNSKVFALTKPHIFIVFIFLYNIFASVLLLVPGYFGELRYDPS